MTQFKKILKGKMPPTVKPWETTSVQQQARGATPSHPEKQEISQPHCVAGREAENAEVRDARGSTPGSVAPTMDDKRSTGASDALGPKDEARSGRLGHPDREALAPSDGGRVSHTVNGPRGARALPDGERGTPPENGGGGQGADRPTEPGARQADVYTDASVCLALGVKRRVLGAARERATRGRDWDAIGEEVGMTGAWIRDFALEHGLMFREEHLERVTGEHVSCRLYKFTPNAGVGVVQLEATGEIEPCRIRNRYLYPLKYGEVFTAQRVVEGSWNHLEWVASLNKTRW